MTNATVTLGRDGMGPESDEADFDAWCGYVTSRLNVDYIPLSIEVASTSDVQEPWRIDTEDYNARDEICGALNDLWDEFCATPEAWPTGTRG